MIDPTVIILGITAMTVAVGIYAVVRLVEVCKPDEVVLISGGFDTGVNIFVAGRRLRVWPFERADRLYVGARELEFDVTDIYSKDFVPVDVSASATVKIGTESPLVDTAARRLLGKTDSEIADIAGGILRGTVRGVVANLTHNELADDVKKLTELVSRESADDLAMLGLRIDSLHIAPR